MRIEAEMLINMQTRYNLHTAHIDKKIMKKLNAIVEIDTSLSFCAHEIKRDA